MSAEMSEISQVENDIPPSDGAVNVTAERIMNVALGAAVYAAESIAVVVSRVRDEAPAFIDILEEKGRPLRLQILDALFGAAPDEAPAGFAPADVNESTVVSVSADDDISALEQRVRELEQQIEIDEKGDTPSIGESGTDEKESLWETMTTAEDATFVRGNEPAYDSLADSPYAVSETDEETAREQDSEGYEEPGH